VRSEFLSKPPSERFKKMILLLKKFKVRTKNCKAPFAILVYSSASYGFKKVHHGNLDDIDLFLVVPRELAALEIIKTAEKVFQTRFDIGQEHLQELLDGNWEMCRMYGETEGMRLGFRMLCTDTFNFLSTHKGHISTVRNVAHIGQSRIVVDVEWSVRQWRYVPTELKHTVIKRGTNNLLLVNHHVFSRNIERLGALGRKLLTCSIVYDLENKTEKSLKAIWRMYVQSCLRHNPDVSTKSIINSVMRSEKFSSAFRRKLAIIINKSRL